MMIQFESIKLIRKVIQIMSTRTKSNIFLFMAAIVWGFAFVAQCDVKIGTGYFLFSRSILGALALIPVILIFERESILTPKFKNTVIYGMITGTVLFIASYLQQEGINIDKVAGKAVFMTGFYSVLVPVFAFIIWKKKTTYNVWIGAFLSIVGLYFLCMTDGYTSVGLSDIYLLTGAVFWSFHILTIDKFIDKVSPIKYSAVQFFTCGMIGLIVGIFTEDAPTLATLEYTLWPIVYCGVFSSGVAYTCQILGQKDADPTYAPIILSTESVFAAIGGMIFLNEVISLRGYMGCILMFMGIVISQLQLKKSKQ